MKYMDMDYGVEDDMRRMTMANVREAETAARKQVRTESPTALTWSLM
jgi:hypothetical protein